MTAVDFEKAFSDFLDGKQYDDAEDALFTIVRAAFRAGWNAAAGEKPLSDPPVGQWHQK